MYSNPDFILAFNFTTAQKQRQAIKKIKQFLPDLVCSTGELLDFLPVQ